MTESLTRSTPAAPIPTIPTDFESSGPDRQAILTVLGDYSRAVSTKDRALFETLLLNRQIPFSSVDAAIAAADRDYGSCNYAAFCKGVFEGAPFTQRFQDIQIKQDGALADVTLVFVNRRQEGASWGWKMLQLLKVDGSWKIASEFYSSHR
jgi:hypothetical protein